MARGWQFSFNRLFCWRVDSSGIATGQIDPATVAAALSPTTSHALDIRGPISATLPEPTYTVFEAVGGGTYEGSAQGGVEALGQGEITIDQLDPSFFSLVRGGLLDVTTILGGPTIYSDNSLTPDPFDVGLMFVMRKQRLDGTRGNIYTHIIFPRVTVTFQKPSPTQEGGTNTQPLIARFSPQVADKFPWGEAFGATQGWYNYSETAFCLDSDYPYALTYFLADGVDIDFISAFKPQYSDVTNGRTNNVTALDGVPTAMTSISTSTGTFTLAAAGSDLDQWVAFYPTQRYAAV